jgi:hypothetical protein
MYQKMIWIVWILKKVLIYIWRWWSKSILWTRYFSFMIVWSIPRRSLCKGVYWFFPFQVFNINTSEILNLLPTYQINFMQCIRTFLRNIKFWGRSKIVSFAMRNDFQVSVAEKERSTYIFQKCHLSSQIVCKPNR